MSVMELPVPELPLYTPLLLAAAGFWVRREPRCARWAEWGRACLGQSIGDDEDARHRARADLRGIAARKCIAPGIPPTGRLSGPSLKAAASSAGSFLMAGLREQVSAMYHYEQENTKDGFCKLTNVVLFPVEQHLCRRERTALWRAPVELYIPNSVGYEYSLLGIVCTFYEIPIRAVAAPDQSCADA
jgi:hypothetical protein